MALLPFGSAPTPIATAIKAGKVKLFQWGSAWNDIGLAETVMTVPQGQDIIFVQRLKIESGFTRLTLNGRLIGIALTNSAPPTTG